MAIDGDCGCSDECLGDEVEDDDKFESLDPNELEELVELIYVVCISLGVLEYLLIDSPVIPRSLNGRLMLRRKPSS